MTENENTQTLAELLSPHVTAMEANIDRWLIEPDVPEKLAEAMRYCMTGGKRLRPTLLRLAAEAAGGENQELIDRAALAVEMIHVYSLVHDDLPAMDDDALRRGRPTAHVKFGEAMAILVGDALLTRAMGVIAETQISKDTPSVLANLVAELAVAAGSAGMVAGQVADMDLCEVPDGIEGLEFIHTRKTGAMLRAAVRMGAIAAGASEDCIEALTDYAGKLGLAFQIFDDLLDATGTVEELGKTPGKDAQAGKRTYVTLLGLQKAQQLGGQLTEEAIQALAPLAEKAEKLRTIARLLTDRKH